MMHHPLGFAFVGFEDVASVRRLIDTHFLNMNGKMVGAFDPIPSHTHAHIGRGEGNGATSRELERSDPLPGIWKSFS